MTHADLWRTLLVSTFCITPGPFTFTMQSLTCQTFLSPEGLFFRIIAHSFLSTNLSPPPPPLPGQHSLEATCFWRKHERMRLCFLQNNTWSLQISFWIQLIACYFLYILAWEGFSYQRWYILFHEDAPGRDNVGGLSAYWTNSCLVLSITASVQWAQTSLGSWQRFLLLSELHKSTENSEDQ